MSHFYNVAPETKRSPDLIPCLLLVRSRYVFKVQCPGSLPIHVVAYCVWSCHSTNGYRCWAFLPC
ncbi:hypothetical protein J6590_051360 [Homalodisca vitripennis]|nr:hypothetical protein J6590_051360 [Homalodisca vitripennis]